MNPTETSAKPVTIGTHHGRPTVFIDGAPVAPAAYSPVAMRREPMALAQTRRFFPHHLDAYFLTLPGSVSDDFFATPFWVGDEFSAVPREALDGDLGKLATEILHNDPNAKFIMRFGPYEPESWRDLHPEDLFHAENGEILPTPSLASQRYIDAVTLFCQASVTWCEAQPWGHAIIGYWNGCRNEGTHDPLIKNWLIDHSPVMRQLWRDLMIEKYGEAFAETPLPSERLHEGVQEVAAQPYFQSRAENQPLRDYWELSRRQFHLQFRGLCAAMNEARGDRNRFLIYDGLKLVMMGWNNLGFFDANWPWPAAFNENLAGSGHIGVSELLDIPGFDGVITPHDYHARGIGGVYEPEGIAESCVLRGKLFFCEMDTRTYAGTDVNFPARDATEFAAVTWRNLATSLTRGFVSYWMDVYQDWFAPELHAIIGRQVEVLKDSVNWEHRDVPGIAVILDDEAVLETNGSGHVFNEQIIWEPKLGLARCGVPVRTYLFDDLKSPDFPDHRVLYFPNLYRADPERVRFLREHVLKKGRVVIWGPGSGVSDGQRLGVESAQALTGFDFALLPVNYHRRTIITDFSHPLTQGLGAGSILGGPLAYGPILFPRTGRELGRAWTKGGRDLCGLNVLEYPEWTSVFTTATPLPAEFWRNAARLGGAHVYCESDDIVLADAAIVALHSVQSGPKCLRLPTAYDVQDVISGETIGRNVTEIQFEVTGPETRVFRLMDV